MLTMKHIQKLISGYKVFYKNYFGRSPKATTFRSLVQKGQKPEIMLICCSDARIDPSVLFQCEPGDLFVVRNVANLVPPFAPDGKHHSTSSALEFAVKHLSIKEIIVLGHSQCGGIQTLLDTPNLAEAEQTHKSFIYNWVQIAKEAKEKTLQTKQEVRENSLECTCAKEALKISIKNLHTFPWIEEKVQQGQLGLHGWYLDLEKGNLEFLTGKCAK